MRAGSIRSAGHGDVTEILAMIRELAAYEHSEHLVEADEQQVRELLFGGSDGVAPATHVGRPAAYCHVVEHDDPASGRRLGGFALWFLNTSTWTGRHGIYLEDLYVRPEYRGLGYGRALLATLAAICVEHGYRRLEWWVLDWNEPALGFYRALGAQAMDEWTVHRVSGASLRSLAASAPPSGPAPGLPHDAASSGLSDDDHPPLPPADDG